jgi:hypothetical protein
MERRPLFSLSNSRQRSRRRPGERSRARGQALVEFAITFPLFIIALFLAWLGWLIFQQEGTYLNSSQALSEQVARQGEYTPAMAQAIEDQLNTTNGVSSNNAVLFILAVDPNTDLVLGQCGTRPPASAGNNPSLPDDTGWVSCARLFAGPPVTGHLDSLALPVGTRVEVDVWSYQRMELPIIPVGTWLTPTGHSVSYVLKG